MNSAIVDKVCVISILYACYLLVDPVFLLRIEAFSEHELLSLSAGFIGTAELEELDLRALKLRSIESLLDSNIHEIGEIECMVFEVFLEF